MLIKTVVKRGNSNYILMDQTLLDIANLETGAKVSVTFEDGKIILTPIEKNVNLPVEKDVD